MFIQPELDLRITAVAIGYGLQKKSKTSQGYFLGAEISYAVMYELSGYPPTPLDKHWVTECRHATKSSRSDEFDINELRSTYSYTYADVWVVGRINY